jgi:hypothetical protein
MAAKRKPRTRVEFAASVTDVTCDACESIIAAPSVFSLRPTKGVLAKPECAQCLASRLGAIVSDGGTMFMPEFVDEDGELAGDN